MKALINSMVVLLLAAGIAGAQNVTVQGEKTLNTDFSKYKTFTWVENDSQLRNPKLVEYRYEKITPVHAKATSGKSGKKYESKKHIKESNEEVVIYSYSYLLPSSDTTINRVITRSVNEELEGRGYHKDGVNPDLFVAYRIFDGSTHLKGYSAEPTVMTNGKEIRQPQDTVTYAIKPGTLLITLIDAKTSSVVWEGFASGIVQRDELISDKIKVKEAVNLIFKKYEWRADKYAVNND